MLPLGVAAGAACATTTAPTHADPHVGWPAGWDDKDSAFFVPPELRDFYDRAADRERGRAVEVAQMRQDMIVVELPGKVTVDTGFGTKSYEREARQLKPLDDAGDMALAVHALACRDARRAYQADRDRQEHADLDKLNVCPYCGAYAAVRMRGGGNLPSGVTIKPACGDCEREAVRADEDLTAAAAIADGKTRREVIAAAVAKARKAAAS